MTSVLFELGGLAACITLVAMTADGSAVVDALSRSFLVFIGVVIVGSVGGFAAQYAAARSRKSRVDAARREALAHYTNGSAPVE
jgi:hypothetical protein